MKRTASANKFHAGNEPAQHNSRSLQVIDQEQTYWIVEGEPAVGLLKDIRSKTAECRKMVRAFCERFGSSGEVLRCGGRVTAIKIDRNPDAKLWKENREHKGFYSPIRKSTEGRALAKELDSFQLPDSWACTQTFFGVPFVPTDMRHVSGLTHHILDGKDIFEIPSSDQLKPVAGIRQIKASEFWTLVEASKARQPGTVQGIKGATL